MPVLDVLLILTQSLVWRYKRDHPDYGIVVDELSGQKPKGFPTKSLGMSDVNPIPCNQERDEHQNLGNAAHRALGLLGHFAQRALDGDYRARFCSRMP